MISSKPIIFQNPFYFWVSTISATEDVLVVRLSGLLGSARKQEARTLNNYTQSQRKTTLFILPCSCWQKLVPLIPEIGGLEFTVFLEIVSRVCATTANLDCKQAPCCYF